MEEKIIKLLEEMTGESVSRDTDILSDLGLSSLEIMSLISDLEEEFDVKIKAKAMKKVETIGDLVDLITELKEG
ncbi:MAG: acyl carrier protein [Acetatifactor sp.]|nr:acyl carrier protein [Acetatifactor sp.]